MRHASTLRRRDSAGSSATSGSSRVPPIETTFQPGLTPVCAALLSGSTLLTTTTPSTRRTSIPVSPDMSCAAFAALSPLAGMTAKCDWPRRPSMSLSTARNSPTVFAAAAFGRSSVRTAFQSTPLRVRSKCESRTSVHAASNVVSGSASWAKTTGRLDSVAIVASSRTPASRRAIT